jgi:hypothetical protein
MVAAFDDFIRYINLLEILFGEFECVLLEDFFEMMKLFLGLVYFLDGGVAEAG